MDRALHVFRYLVPYKLGDSLPSNPARPALLPTLLRYLY